MLSVVMITKNAERYLDEVLKAASSIANEIIIVDSGSTDNTEKIAHKYDARFSLKTNWQGFGVQKNHALKLAKGEWVLFIDADEVLTKELILEITSLIKVSEIDGYYIERKDIFLGQTMKGAHPKDWVLRLFKRKLFKYSNNLVHEKLEAISTVNTAYAKGELLHYSYSSIEEIIEKINRYSSLAAQDMKAKGMVSTVMSAFLHSYSAFIKHYLLHLGFLNGARGYIYAKMKAEHSFYKHLKSWMLS